MTEALRERAHRAHARICVKEFLTLVAASGSEADFDAVWPQVRHAQAWIAARPYEDEEATELLEKLLLGYAGFVVQPRLPSDLWLEWLHNALARSLGSNHLHEARPLAGAIADARLRRGEYVEAVAAFAVSLNLGSDQDPRLYAQDTDGVATAYAAVGQENAAERLFNQVLERLAQLGEHNSEAVTLAHRAETRLRWDDTDGALEDLQRARDLFAKAGYGTSRELEATYLLASARAGRVYSALNVARSLVPEPAVDQAALDALLLLGKIKTIANLHREALEDFRAARDLAQSLMLDDALDEALAGAAAAYRELGDTDSCEQTLRMRNDVAAALAVRRRWQALTDLAEAIAVRDRTAASQLHRQALNLVREQSFPYRFDSAAPSNFADDLAIATSKVALALIGTKETQPDWHAADEALRALTGSPRLRASLLAKCAALAFELGEHDRALALQQRRAALLQRVGNKRALAHAVGECADAYAELGHRPEAIALYHQVAALDREIGDHRDEVHALNNIGWNMAQNGDLDGALEFVTQAARMSACHGYRLGRLNLLANAAHIAAQVPAPDYLDNARSAYFRASVLGLVLGYNFAEPEDAIAALSPADIEDLESRIAELKNGFIQDVQHDRHEDALEKAQAAAILSSAAASATHDVTMYAAILSAAANAALKVNNFPAAAEALLDLESVAAVAGMEEEEDWAQDTLGRTLAYRLDDPDAGIEVLLRRVERARARGREDRLGNALFSLAEARLETAEEELVPPILDELINLARRAHDLALEVRTLHLDSLLRRSWGDKPGATEVLRRAMYLVRTNHIEDVPDIESENANLSGS